MLRDSLLRHPICSLLRSPELDHWIACGRELDFAAGETIFQEASCGDWAYVLIEGRVRVLRLDDQNGEVSLAMLHPGELFGEYALVQPYQNTATCRAAVPSRLLRLPLSL